MNVLASFEESSGHPDGAERIQGPEPHLLGTRPASTL